MSSSSGRSLPRWGKTQRGLSPPVAEAPTSITDVIDSEVETLIEPVDRLRVHVDRKRGRFSGFGAGKLDTAIPLHDFIYGS